MKCGATSGLAGGRVPELQWVSSAPLPRLESNKKVGETVGWPAPRVLDRSCSRSNRRHHRGRQPWKLRARATRSAPTHPTQAQSGRSVGSCAVPSPTIARPGPTRMSFPHHPESLFHRRAHQKRGFLAVPSLSVCSALKYTRSAPPRNPHAPFFRRRCSRGRAPRAGARGGVDTHWSPSGLPRLLRVLHLGAVVSRQTAAGDRFHCSPLQVDGAVRRSSPTTSPPARNRPARSRGLGARRATGTDGGGGTRARFTVVQSSDPAAAIPHQKGHDQTREYALPKSAPWASPPTLQLAPLRYTAAQLTQINHLRRTGHNHARLGVVLSG